MTGPTTAQPPAGTANAADPATIDPPPTADPGNAATAPAWEELGSYEDVKRSLEHARLWQKRAKDNSDAATKLAQLEDAQKTEQQRLTDQLHAKETELADYRAREVRLAAVRAAGLDIDLAEFLTATEPDAAAAQAKVLAKRLTPPKADLKQGARPNATPPQDMNAWLRKAAGYTDTP